MTDLTRIAHQIRAQLREHRADLAPRDALATRLGVTEPTITAAASRSADLGVCGPFQRPHVWWLPTPPLKAGFEPVHQRGHLVLRMAAPNPNDAPLYLAARNIAAPRPEAPPIPALERLALGPLAGTVSRLCLLTPNGCEVFGLIAHTWRTGAVVFEAGPLQVRQTEQPPQDLELVTWLDDHGDLQVINLYPVGMHHLVFDTERHNGSQ